MCHYIINIPRQCHYPTFKNKEIRILNLHNTLQVQTISSDAPLKRALSIHIALPPSTHMLMIPPTVKDCQDSFPGGGQETGAAVDDNQVGPFWWVGYEFHCQSSLIFIVEAIRRTDRHHRQTRERPTGRLNNPSGLMVV